MLHFSFHSIFLCQQVAKKGQLSPFFMVGSFDLFFDLSSLTNSAAQIVELASANLTVSDNLDINHVRAVYRKYSFNADAI